MIRVRIPATTANLGPGFDSIGLALDLWNSFELHLDGNPGEIRIETTGEGADFLPTDRTNLVAQTLLDETWPGMMPTDAGILIRCKNDVPAASGLGSSSTATLAGLIFASALAARAMNPNTPEKVLEMVRSEENLNRVLRRSIQLEGHGDNVAPALLGGLVLVTGEPDQIVRQVEFAPLKAVVCVPKFNFLTSVARAALPAEISKSDAIFNIGRAMLVLEAFRAGDYALLERAMDDRLHQPYRLPKIPGAAEALTSAKVAGASAACMSGAGPGMIAFASSHHNEIGVAMVEAFGLAGLEARFWVLNAVRSGCSIE